MLNVKRLAGEQDLTTATSPYARKSSHTFHIDLLECLTDAVLSADKHLFSLKKFDIIVATGFKEVHLSPLAENSKAAASASFRLLQPGPSQPVPGRRQRLDP
ncbi:hypothetical protein LJ046_08330 [Lactobacillus delbrueckii subsp. jakobsenii ZN7a-9 = DSM 26046]|uniref:hypothetical protein n=1 Tax=Lactobacillus delbrueckii TaxID=1584 RepID=UPI00032DAC10|nr:hypothetical protein [Lactobacillus delbrueckii]APG73628.1 hypothetical protein LJ046_08330 [Lactobacillus delbrueckii subsp. jakobsenii ZN7a-9 = DSM 26046]EOD02273.1 Putative transcriptional regulator [Lactobacillus delbrueckii subsp. jakobsenii ZN7a-9 = DSM 26046]TDG63491.1 hypothetical protein C5L19_001230 [Lactobacillus delbrueckii subsp. jakobsenii]